MEDFRELKLSEFAGGLVIELMGSMINLAVQKHQSALGFALSQKNISALTKPLKDIIRKRPNKTSSRSEGCKSSPGTTTSVVGESADPAGLANLFSQETGYQSCCLPPLSRSPFQACLIICQPRHSSAALCSQSSSVHEAGAKVLSHQAHIPATACQVPASWGHRGEAQSPCVHAAPQDLGMISNPLAERLMHSREE